MESGRESRGDESVDEQGDKVLPGEEEPGFVDVADYNHFDSGDDPLLSIEEISRQFTTDVDIIRQLVLSGGIHSLDRGLLASEGRLDVPVVRLSWANAVRRDSTTAWRRLDDQRDGEFHEAAQVAIDFHGAVVERDGPTAIALCVPQTVAYVGADEICDRVVMATSSAAFSSGASIATGVYSLDPIDAVAVRVIRGAGPLPRRVDMPTPVTLLAVIPFREIDAQWRVDFDLLVDQGSLWETLQIESS